MNNKGSPLAGTTVAFSGQGTQFVGMGNKQLLSPTLLQADEILGYSLSSICKRGPQQKLNDTRYAQPAVYAVSYALYTLLAIENEPPTCFTGHSLGEYTALAASGAISFKDGLKLVDERARAMAKCSGGMTVIVGMDVTAINRLLAMADIPDLWIANINTDSQITLAGSIEALNQIEHTLQNVHNARLVKRLAVGSACHSPMMTSAKPALNTALSRAGISQPRTDLFCSKAGRICTDPQDIANSLSNQLDSTLDWTSAVRSLVSNETKRFLEIGPRTVLRGMIKHLVDTECTSFTVADLR